MCCPYLHRLNKPQLHLRRLYRYPNTLPKPTLMRGPYLQVATSNSIIVRWRAEALSRSRVRFGTDAGKLDGFSGDFTLVTEHKVKLNNLMPRTRYYYSIGSLYDTLQGDRETCCSPLLMARKAFIDPSFRRLRNQFCSSKKCQERVYKVPGQQLPGCMDTVG